MDNHSTLYKLQKRQILSLLNIGIMQELGVYKSKHNSKDEFRKIIVDLLNFKKEDADLLAGYFQKICEYIINKKGK